MKTFRKLIIRSAIFLCCVLILGGIAFINQSNRPKNLPLSDFLKKLIEKNDNYNKQLSEEKVYLHFDKSFYKPGETIWFSAYLRNGKNLKASDKSDILNVEIISPKGSILKKMKLIAKKGKALGDFMIEEELPGGMYKVKAYTAWQKNEKNPFFFEKEIQVQKVILPNLKMKLDFERKAFGSGDQVIAKLKLQSNENRLLKNYQFKYIAKLEGKKFITKKLTTDEEGICYIKFNLPKRLKSNDGLLNVLINYQGQTESISRSIPIILNNIKFFFFPEGGDMVANLDNRVAFKALNEFGKPADVKGFIENSKGEKVSTFESFHKGMGAFKFAPKEDEKYFARITEPNGIKEKFELPEALSRGYVLSVNKVQKKKLNLNVFSTENEELSIVAQVRGEVFYAEKVAAQKGENNLDISLEKFPSGVTQITLFDSKGIERAERLAFVNKHKQLKISVETDKEKYLPREKVKMTIKVKDERGMPMPANLSLSVCNDQLLTFADDKTGNILSQLLLEQDINCKVEEAAFYFNPEEKKAEKALDYLLMTSGWRRYTWQEVLENDIPTIAHQAEKTIIKGVVKDYYTGKAIKNAEVVFGGNIKIKTDKNGSFAINNLDLSKPENRNIKIKSEKYSDFNQVLNNYSNSLVFNIYDNRLIPVDEMVMDDVMALENLAGGAVVKRNKNMVQPVAAPVKAVVKEKKKEEANKNVQHNLKVLKQNNKVANENKADKDVEMPDMEKIAEVIDVDEEDEMGEIQEILVDPRIVMEEAKKRRAEPIINQKPKVVYYRAKEFAAPIYDQPQKVEIRTDFRETVYWNGRIETGRNGKAEIEFYNNDAITSFRTTVEGIAADGSVGRTEMKYFTQLPFAMKVKFPVEAATEDLLTIPLNLKNNTNSTIKGELKIISPESLISQNEIDAIQKINAGESKTLYLKYKVSENIGVKNFNVSFASQGLSDAFSKEITIVPKGFPAIISISNSELKKSYNIEIKDLVKGSLKAELTAYPSVVSDLVKGVEGILREPYGCFEQTSMSSYPNLMVMDYLKTMEIEDDKLLARAERLLDKGYKRLITYETPKKGYEWFGGAPAHEALTAYGLMQFNDMKAVKNIDNGMIDRTAKWLMSRKDGKGGFMRNPRALDSFGGASSEITNAYIVYALSEAGYKNIEKEIEVSYKEVLKNKDPYCLALMTNALFSNKKNKDANKLMNLLYATQNNDGSFNGKKHSITRSTGISLKIETTSLSIMAMLKSGKPKNLVLNNAVKYLIGSRSGYGVFGSTQGTILALKALTEYAKYSKKTDENGTVQFFVDGKKVAEKSYKAGERDPIELKNLEKYLSEGKEKLTVKYKGAKKALPYSLAISWNTSLPNSAKECSVDLECKTSAKKVKVGETLRLTAKITNKTKEGLPTTMAIIGIPAGLSAQAWQLKEFQEKKMVDYYEVKGNRIFLYYRQMKPEEVKTINFDLKAELPGKYEAPASCAYLYYTNEFKTWTNISTISIVK